MFTAQCMGQLHGKTEVKQTQSGSNYLQFTILITDSRNKKTFVNCNMYGDWLIKKFNENKGGVGYPDGTTVLAVGNLSFWEKKDEAGNVISKGHVLTVTEITQCPDTVPF